jgi:hypothetical protein
MSHLIEETTCPSNIRIRERIELVWLRTISHEASRTIVDRWWETLTHHRQLPTSKTHQGTSSFLRQSRLYCFILSNSERVRYDNESKQTIVNVRMCVRECHSIRPERTITWRISSRSFAFVCVFDTAGEKRMNVEHSIIYWWMLKSMNNWFENSSVLCSSFTIHVVFDYTKRYSVRSAIYMPISPWRDVAPIFDRLENMRVYSEQDSKTLSSCAPG